MWHSPFTQTFHMQLSQCLPPLSELLPSAFCWSTFTVKLPGWPCSFSAHSWSVLSCLIFEVCPSVFSSLYLKLCYLLPPPLTVSPADCLKGCSEQVPPGSSGYQFVSQSSILGQSGASSVCVSFLLSKVPFITLCFINRLHAFLWYNPSLHNITRLPIIHSFSRCPY